VKLPGYYIFLEDTCRLVPLSLQFDQVSMDQSNEQQDLEEPPLHKSPTDNERGSFKNIKFHTARVVIRKEREISDSGVTDQEEESYDRMVDVEYVGDDG